MSSNMEDQRKDTKIKHPFLTGIKYSKDQEFVGIMQNHNKTTTSFYDFNALRTDEEKRLFIEAGTVWWRESNRITPINFFMPNTMDDFQHVLTHLITKHVEFVFGPIISIDNIQKKRSKKKNHRIIVSEKS